MKSKTEYIFNNPYKTNYISYEFDVCKSKAQSELLIKQMREKLSRSYEGTLLKLHDMNMTIEFQNKSKE